MLDGLLYRTSVIFQTWLALIVVCLILHAIRTVGVRRIGLLSESRFRKGVWQAGTGAIGLLAANLMITGIPAFLFSDWFTLPDFGVLGWVVAGVSLLLSLAVAFNGWEVTIDLPTGIVRRRTGIRVLGLLPDRNPVETARLDDCLHVALRRERLGLSSRYRDQWAYSWSVYLVARERGFAPALLATVSEPPGWIGPWWKRWNDRRIRNAWTGLAELLQLPKVEIEQRFD